MKFEDANAKSGLPDDLFGLGLAVGDVNGDGRPDFFAGHSNRMFFSTGKDGYTESAELNQTFRWKPLNPEDWPCGAAFGDLNRDGLPDLVLSLHHAVARNRIFLNEGAKDGVPRFRDVTKEAGLPDSVAEKSPHVEIQDFDNDGWPDLYFSTAWMDDDGAVEPLIYRNTGPKGGIPVFTATRKSKTGDKIVYYPAGPACDVDGDGRTDIFLDQLVPWQPLAAPAQRERRGELAGHRSAGRLLQPSGHRHKDQDHGWREIAGGAGDGHRLRLRERPDRTVPFRFLHPALERATGYTPIGTFSSALSADGSTLFVTWNGAHRIPDPSKKAPFQSVAMTAIRIPESERQTR